MIVTLGAELELANVDTRIKLPNRLGLWDYKDGSIANSCGAANDPLKKLNIYGGEVNTVWTERADDLADIVSEIYEKLEVNDESFNFTTNLHVHAGIEGLANNLSKLKMLAKYINEQEDKLYTLVDHLPKVKLIKHNNATPAQIGEIIRYKRRLRSHQYRVPKNRYELMMKANSTGEFRDAHLSFDKYGKPMWHLLTRAGVNLASLWKHGTVEFRCFTCSPDIDYMYNAFKFVKVFMKDALGAQVGVRKIVESHNFEFQPYFPYSYDQDVIFQLTSVYKNSRKQAKENYIKLLKAGALTEKDIGVKL